VRSGSFAAAADRLCLTAAAVSLRIRTLEQDLGTALFVRKGRRATPTSAAITLAKRVDRAIGEIDTALNEFHGARPVVRVTAPPSFTSRWLAPRIARYRSEHPDVAIELDVSTDLRSNDAFDVAVRTGPGSWRGLRAHPLFPVDLTPMLSPSLADPRSLARPSDLEQLTLLPHPDWPRWFQEADGAAERRLRYAAIEYPSHELNAEAALAGEGVALLPRSLFGSMLEDGTLAAPFDHVLQGADWHFVAVHDDEMRPAPTTFLAWLRAQAAGGERPLE
jgi:LysR family glycine cleavage system transcriptional activator